MKPYKKISIISLVIIFMVLITININNKMLYPQVKAYTNSEDVTDIALSPGKNPTELNYNWYSKDGDKKSAVQIALKSDMDSDEFPINKAKTFYGEISKANDDFFANKVIVQGIEESKEYVYRLGDGTNWSKVYNFSSRNPNQFSFFCAGDPQIGASGNIASDEKGWINTINNATNKFPNASFLISVGDQINKGNNEQQYTAYFAPKQFQSLPIAAVAGNHEGSSKGHTYHFNPPNMKNPGDDYDFKYGDALFLMLNSNNTNEDEHASFMEKTINENPNAKWKIVVLHHSLYSSGGHEDDSAIVERRNALVPVFDKLGIDVVLSGHDHSYTRTYQMQGGKAMGKTEKGMDGAILNPTGTLYITENSASGSKYYKIDSKNNSYYEAFKQQIKVPTISVINVDKNSFEINTYRTDNMEVTDKYKIVKS
ncbi:purple acid phosphatase family protein [Clostridium akagii]|uniref:purple acid phosphatase family protein n=1 Tax=Clostridium akagii TaxID=91623 RepID=UPI00056A82F5|nr:metallophosphoesterase family protein [Clostridium akagii]